MQQVQDGPSPGRRRVITAVVGGLVAAGLAVGVTVTALSGAGAQTPTPSPEAKKEMLQHKLMLGGPGRGPKGLMGMHGAIHGEFTVRKPEGGFQTMAVQFGEVTAVSSSSITVKSEDGFSRAYAVNEDTMVGAGRDGIGNVEKGDNVHVRALVEGDKARALHIVDITNLKNLRGKFGERPPRSPGS